MKNLIFFGLAILLSACATSGTVVSIPGKQVIELDYPNYDVYEATLKNKSLQGLDVAVRSKDGNEQVRGFGLGTKGKVEVLVESENKLAVSNNNNSPVSLQMWVKEKDRSVFNKEGEYVSFTLRNTSAKSIPLLIPSVMNPNLSPMSKSGVDLKMGQEILFRVKGKNYILLTVDENIKNGDEINVPELLKARKEELGLK